MLIVCVRKVRRNAVILSATHPYSSDREELVISSIKSNLLFQIIFDIIGLTFCPEINTAHLLLHSLYCKELPFHPPSQAMKGVSAKCWQEILPSIIPSLEEESNFLKEVA